MPSGLSFNLQLPRTPPHLWLLPLLLPLLLLLQQQLLLLLLLLLLLELVKPLVLPPSRPPSGAIHRLPQRSSYCLLSDKKRYRQNEMTVRKRPQNRHK